MRTAMISICVLATSSALGGLACGHHAAKPPVEGRPTVTADPTGDPVAMLHALAKAAHDDDGAALDHLIHPALGLWLWDQPGAALAPFLQLHGGTGDKPSARIAAAGLNQYWTENFWPAVAGGLDRGLAALDQSPPDRSSPAYGDCGADDATGGKDLRAWLGLGEDLTWLQPMLDDAQITLDARAAANLTHFHAWGLDVYLARDQGRWWIVHVMVSTPCDA